jgi:hypothetical protein
MATAMNHDTNAGTSCNNNGGTGNAFYCDLCNIAFNKQASFDKHLLSSKHSDSKFVKGFAKEYEQEIPTGTGTGFTCDKCSKNYKYKASFLTHAKTCGKVESGGIENTATSTTVQPPASAPLPSTSPANDTTLLLVNEIATMMKTMSQIVTTLDLTIVTLNKMYNKN